MWQMNGNQVTLNQSVGTMGTSWDVAGVEDFNGDGKSDILWHNDNGSLVMWQMNGTQIVKNQTVGSVTTDWHVADTGDYNNDGFADIAWQQRQRRRRDVAGAGHAGPGKRRYQHGRRRLASGVNRHRAKPA